MKTNKYKLLALIKMKMKVINQQTNRKGPTNRKQITVKRLRRYKEYKESKYKYNKNCLT